MAAMNGQTDNRTRSSRFDTLGPVATDLPYTMTTQYPLETIGRIHACYQEKFGIPRQPGLVPIRGEIEILPKYAREEAFRGLEAFSHIWVIFVFHEAMREQWKPTVRPPRLGGNERMGVFASRSMFRPNPLGLSVVELLQVTQEHGGIRLQIRGGDFLNGTPVLDIKPYLPYVDAIPDAQGGYAPQAPEATMAIRFGPEARARLEAQKNRLPELEASIRAILGYDPRPAYKEGNNKNPQQFAMRLYDFDIKWQVEGQQLTVYAIEEC